MHHTCITQTHKGIVLKSSDDWHTIVSNAFCVISEYGHRWIETLTQPAQNWQKLKSANNGVPPLLRCHYQFVCHRNSKNERKVWTERKARIRRARGGVGKGGRRTKAHHSEQTLNEHEPSMFSISYLIVNILQLRKINENTHRRTDGLARVGRSGWKWKM